MSKWFLLGMNSPVGFRLKRTSQKNNLNFHIDGFMADMSGRSIAAIRHKRSKIQRSWPVLEWVQYEWVKACNGLPRITATLRSGIFQNASSNFEYSPLDVRVCLWSQDLRTYVHHQQFKFIVFKLIYWVIASRLTTLERPIIHEQRFKMHARGVTVRLKIIMRWYARNLTDTLHKIQNPLAF